MTENRLKITGNCGSSSRICVPNVSPPTPSSLAANSQIRNNRFCIPQPFAYAPFKSENRRLRKLPITIELKIIPVYVKIVFKSIDIRRHPFTHRACNNTQIFVSIFVFVPRKSATRIFSPLRLFIPDQTFVHSACPPVPSSISPPIHLFFFLSRRLPSTFISSVFLIIPPLFLLSIRPNHLNSLSVARQCPRIYISNSVKRSHTSPQHSPFFDFHFTFSQHPYVRLNNSFRKLYFYF